MSEYPLSGTYQLRVVCERCDQELGSVSVSIPDTPSGVFWALRSATVQIGDILRAHRVRVGAAHEG